MKSWDAIIIGGGIIGLATGYYLTKKGKRVIVLEKDEIGAGSTGRCIGGIRQQFSTPCSIKLAMKSVELFARMDQEFGFSVEFEKSGYLFLAFTEEQKKKFLKAIEIQRKQGLEVYFIDAKEVKKLVPGIDAEGLIGGAYSPQDGQAYPFAVIRGFAMGISRTGEVRRRARVVDIMVENASVKGVVLEGGEKLFSDVVINAAGPWGKEVGKMAGLDLPLYPERHEAFITRRWKMESIPMIVDYRKDGGYFQQRINGQIIGCYTPVPNVPGKRTDSTFEFLKEMSYRMARVIPELADAQVLRQWAGSYTMTPDGNPIVDESEIEGFYIAGGMSGHGFMFGPAVGWALSNKIVDGEWGLNMQEFSIRRSFQKAELLK